MGGGGRMLGFDVIGRVTLHVEMAGQWGAERYWDARGLRR